MSCDRKKRERSLFHAEFSEAVCVANAQRNTRGAPLSQKHSPTRLPTNYPRD